MLENKIEDRLHEIEETRMWVGSFLKKCYTKFMNINTDNNENVLELFHIEIYERCLLNIKTGEKKFDKGKWQVPYFQGLYFRDEDTFFALYPTENGPMMYYEGREYPLKKDLHIRLTKMDKLRKFCIDEYHICIQYHTSPYIGFDVWSEEEDVDLFYQIEQSYKNDDYYKKYTR